MKELEIVTRQQAGIAAFDNFDEIKAYLEAAMTNYKDIVYTDDRVKDAKSDRTQLKKLKTALDDRRKEIKKIYMAPYADVELKVKELIGLIDEPLKQIEDFIKQVDLDEKARQRLTVRGYFDSISASLGELADSVFNSPSFYNPKWDNKSTSVKAWQDEVAEKVKTAAHDIQTLQSAGGAHTGALLAEYLKTLDIESTIAYGKNIAAAEKLSEAAMVIAEDGDDTVIGYKILKINGTRRQMDQILEQLELMGMEYDELEDGMPGTFTELDAPNFDTFVCFDIETSGTFGAANGDEPGEITEIGAVKVINGEIVDKQDWLCNPGRKITPRIEKLTHITNEMVANEPPVAEVIRAFADYAGDMPLVGHNIKSSDLGYIGRAAKRAGVAMSNPFFDTYRYAKKFKAAQGWENVKLEYLSEQFGISQPDAHRALCDAEANVGVYFKLKEMK